MRCPSCGRECADESNFCFYCGHSFRGHIPSDELQAVKVEAPVETNTASTETSMKPIQWAFYVALTFFASYIWPVWLVVTCLWAFGSNGSAERKAFAKGALIAVVILVTIAMVTAIVMVSTYGIDGTINILTNGTATSADAFFKMYGLDPSSMSR